MILTYKLHLLFYLACHGIEEHRHRSKVFEDKVLERIFGHSNRSNREE
jgi:hypothetical protein